MIENIRTCCNDYVYIPSLQNLTVFQFWNLQKIGGKHHPKICVLSPPLVVLPAYVFYIEDYFVIWREKNCRNLHYGWTAKCIIIGGNWHKFICLFVCFHNIKKEFSEFAQIYKLLVFWQLLMKQHSWTLLTVCK